MNEMILIGGAAGAGKSTIAEQLAKHLQMPWISTDQVRRILRLEETDETKKVELVWQGTSAFLHGAHPWDGGIIEGTAILPDLIARDLKDLENIRPVFLIQSEEQIVRIIENRSKLSYINTKTPEQQAEKVKTISAFNHSIKERAEEHNYPCIEAHTESTLSDVLTALDLK